MSRSLCDGHIPPVSIASNDSSVNQISSSASLTTQVNPIDKLDAILVYLERLDQLNQALTKRVASSLQIIRTRPILHPSVSNPTQSTLQIQYPVE